MYLMKRLAPMVVVVIAACGGGGTGGVASPNPSSATASTATGPANATEASEVPSSTSSAGSIVSQPPLAQDRGMLGADTGLGSAAVSRVRDEAELEYFLRDWLATFHMRPVDVECFVREVKASSSWHPETLSYSLTEQDSSRLVAAYGIDISKLWVVAGD